MPSAFSRRANQIVHDFDNLLQGLDSLLIYDELDELSKLCAEMGGRIRKEKEKFVDCVGKPDEEPDSP